MPTPSLPKELQITQDAEQQAQTALSSNPQDDGALHTLGLAKYGAGQPQEALDLIVQANKLNPTNPEYCLSLGRILAREKMHNQATLALLAAQELAPDNPVVLTELAESLLALGKQDEAKVVLQAATEIYRERVRQAQGSGASPETPKPTP